MGSGRRNDLIPLSSQVVERYIFQSVYNKLFDKFAQKHTEQDALFFKKVLELRDFNDRELLENLEVKAKV